MRSEGFDMDRFTMPLALTDALPVALFSASAVCLGKKLNSKLFAAGAVSSVAAGSSKVIWKLIIAAKKENHEYLPKAYRVLMPAGFALMGCGMAARPRITAALFRNALKMPQAALFAVGTAGMTAMGIYASKLDNSARSNWIEEITNTAAQASILAGVLNLK